MSERRRATARRFLLADGRRPEDLTHAVLCSVKASRMGCSVPLRRRALRELGELLLLRQLRRVRTRMQHAEGDSDSARAFLDEVGALAATLGASLESPLAPGLAGARITLETP